MEVNGEMTATKSEKLVWEIRVELVTSILKKKN